MREYGKVDYLPRGKASEDLTEGCLVLEGGGFRGIYTQGVLDYLMQQNINMQTVIGVSAGALAGYNYVAGQIGRSARNTLRYRHDHRYVGLKAIRRSHSLVNVAFMLQDINTDDPLDVERFNRPDQRLIVVTTNYETGETEFHEKGICEDFDNAVKASASLPFISPPVEVHGTLSMDGGCTNKVPFDWAIGEGFEKIVVVKTRERGFRKSEEEKHSARKVYRKHPVFAEAVDKNHLTYNRQLDELDRLEEEGRVFVIAPSEHVTVSRLESDMNKLGDLYYMGYEDAKKILPELKQYLGIR